MTNQSVCPAGYYCPVATTSPLQCLNGCVPTHEDNRRFGGDVWNSLLYCFCILQRIRSYCPIGTAFSLHCPAGYCCYC
jgi:hypothetical protein